MLRDAALAFLPLLLAALPAVAAPRGKAGSPAFRPAAVSPVLKSEMARYSLKAYENRDQTNAVKGLLFTPKPVGMNALPMIVYIPGNGEIGDVARQFRQRAIFDRVMSAEFQEKYPCFLLALTPPASATTILGGMPGHPTGLQKALRDFVLDICRMQASLSNNVRMEGIPWTTLCPAPIIGTPTFPSSNLSEGDVAFGCLLLDTFVKEKSNMVKVIAGDGVSGIAPLRQEGAAYPFGVGFRIKKGLGTIKVKSEAIKVYIESATHSDEFSSGETMDADRITPNGGTVEWAF